QQNIGMCLRALGRYVEAWAAFQRALADPKALSPKGFSETSGDSKEIERIIVRLEVMLVPPNAELLVDGQPLIAVDEAGSNVFTPSDRKGRVRPPNLEKFTLWISPGRHQFRAKRPGHRDAVVVKGYEPGTGSDPDKPKGLDLRLNQLPGIIDI